jgi:hypothetical protein
VDTNTLTCPSCAAGVPAGRFCTSCGSTLDPALERAASYATFDQPTPSASDRSVPPPDQGSSVLQVERVRGWFRGLPLRQKRTVGAAAVAVLLLGLGYATFGGSESHALTGDLSLYADGDLTVGSGCEGVGGYSDITPGAQVVVEDDTGRTLATGALGDGVFDGVACVFDFGFDAVPKASFYRIHQGSNRGVLQYSYQDMVDSDWAVHLTLGDE